MEEVAESALCFTSYLIALNFFAFASIYTSALE